MGNNCCTADRIIDDAECELRRIDLHKDSQIYIITSQSQINDGQQLKEQSDDLNQRVKHKSQYLMKKIKQRASIVQILGIPQPQQQDTIIREHIHQPIKRREMKYVSVTRLDEPQYQQNVKPQRLWTEKIIRNRQIQNERNAMSEFDRNIVMDALQNGEFRNSIFTKKTMINFEQNEEVGQDQEAALMAIKDIQSLQQLFSGEL